MIDTSGGHPTPLGNAWQQWAAQKRKNVQARTAQQAGDW
jgi:hypothetical protein